MHRLDAERECYYKSLRTKFHSPVLAPLRSPSFYKPTPGLFQEIPHCRTALFGQPTPQINRDNEGCFLLLLSVATDLIFWNCIVVTGWHVQV